MRKRKASDRRVSDQAVIRALSAAWAKAAAAKDVSKCISFYANRPFLLLPGAPIASSRSAVKRAWSQMLSSPGSALSFAATKIQVCRAQDMAYEIGHYRLTLHDQEGVPQTSQGKYVVVWAKQAGKWKAVVDAPTTTQ